ncbi:MAG: cytochrome P450 [Ardenticatenaceae bacterium]|nr:cytochrome P450 [Anaerolineales bacterium]MCB8922563.1 cytochrome P450 [Ardenticatenaceae bacterium]
MRLPIATPKTGLRVLKGLARDHSLLTAMSIMRDEVGPAFQITLPGFQPAVMVGPNSNRQIMVSQSQHFHWRSPADPVTKLLRHGLLVEDGESHAARRAEMEPLMQKRHVMFHIPAMQTYTDRVLADWRDGSVQDMLVEMRRAALLVFMGTLLDVEFGPDMERMWQPILRAIKYISPGLWIVWPDMPRPGYKKALAAMDEYLFGIIRERKLSIANGQLPIANDLLTHLASLPHMTDDLIRDQLLTMLIAGHDTSTALLAWALHLLGKHPEAMAQAVAEVDAVVGQDDLSEAHMSQLPYLDSLIKETLRLYPPIHVGNRIVATDTAVSGYQLKAGTRVMASIYLSHRDGRYWEAPNEFRPERFERGAKKPPAFTYIPFGGGARACIGAAFAQVEAKVVLARILQQFELQDVGRKVKPYMGATLEPRPGVFLRVRRRQQ